MQQKVTSPKVTKGHFPMGTSHIIYCARTHTPAFDVYA